ncbi:unnamed protein product [Ectocarpus fasciculatus]
MSRATTDTEAREHGGNPIRVGVAETAAHGPSPKQLRELLHVLMGTPAGIVQQVGYLLMLFVAVVKTGAPVSNDSGAGGGGNCGDSAVNLSTPNQAAPGTAGRTRASTTITCEERKNAIDLLKAAAKEAKKNKFRSMAKASIKNGRCLAKATGGSDVAVKAKTLQCWAAKGKQNVRQLLNLLLGSGAVVNTRPDHARLLKFYAQGISSEEARKGSSAAGATFELMTGIIAAALYDSNGKASNGSASPSSTPSPLSSEADIAVGGEDTPTLATSQLQQLEHLRHDDKRSDLLPISLPGSRIVETLSPSSCRQERRSSNGAQPSNIAGIGIVGHANNNTPAFVPEEVVLATESSTSPPSSSQVLKVSVRGTTAGATRSEETPSSSSKEEMFTIVEAADERWPSSDDDEEEAPLARKRSDSSTERGRGDGENGISTPTPSACTDAVDDPAAAQPAPRQASLVLDEVTNTPGPAVMAAEGGASTSHSPPPAGVTLDQEVVMSSGAALNLDPEASTRSEPASEAEPTREASLSDDVGEPCGGGQIVPYGYMPTAVATASPARGDTRTPPSLSGMVETILSSPILYRTLVSLDVTAANIKQARVVLSGARLPPSGVALTIPTRLPHHAQPTLLPFQAVNIIPSQMDVDPYECLSIGALHEFASFGPLEARPQRQQQLLPDHHACQDDGDDSDGAANSEGENEDEDDAADDDESPPPSASHMEYEHLNDLLRALGGLAARSGSSDGIESDGDQRSSSGSSSVDTDEEDASALRLHGALNDTGSESSRETRSSDGEGLGSTRDDDDDDDIDDIDCDTKMGAYLCLEEREYPRCREGYRKVSEGQARWALSAIRKIADAIDAPTHTVTLAAMILGMAGGLPGFMDALTDEQVCLLPAACVADSIRRLEESGADEPPPVDFDTAIDATLAITKASSAGRGDNGGDIFGDTSDEDTKTQLLALVADLKDHLPEGLFCPDSLHFLRILVDQSGLSDTHTDQELEAFYDKTDKVIRTAVLDGFLRKLSPSDIARGAFFGSAGVSVVSTEQRA